MAGRLTEAKKLITLKWKERLYSQIFYWNSIWKVFQIIVIHELHLISYINLNCFLNQLVERVNIFDIELSKTVKNILTMVVLNVNQFNIYVQTMHAWPILRHNLNFIHLIYVNFLKYFSKACNENKPPSWDLQLLSIDKRRQKGFSVWV